MAYDLTKEINQILMTYADEVELAALRIEEEVAKEAVKKLNKTSPVNPHSHGRKGKHYQKDWYVDNRNKKHYSHIIIANRQYQLTHLLEKGHDIVRNGVKVGRSKAIPHIKPVEQWAKDAVVDRLEFWLHAQRKANLPKIVIEFKG